MNTRRLIKSRTTAYNLQQGRCYYCNAPMWRSDASTFAKTLGIPLAQAWLLQCTGEHLRAHQDGGKETLANIVAACRYCNQHRHKKKRPLDPDSYRQYVQRRLKKGKWHCLRRLSLST